MSAAQKIVEAARIYGGVLTLVGDKLRYRFDRHPPAELVAEMKSHKAELIAFLRRPAPYGLPTNGGHFMPSALVYGNMMVDKHAMTPNSLPWKTASHSGWR